MPPREFYAALFGWEIREPLPEAGGYRMAELRGKPVAGIGPQMQPGMPPAWATYIATADADATAKAVAAAGGRTLMPPMDVLDAGRMAVFADPAGAVFGVWQPRAHQGAGIVNEPDTLCWNELASRDADAVIPFYSRRVRLGGEDTRTWAACRTRRGCWRAGRSPG